jgi:cytochrome c biogenesis protein CcmG/thiol:disulfide interchange protein DsbE
MPLVYNRFHQIEESLAIMSRLKLFIPVLVFFALAIMLWRGLYLDPRTLPSVLIDKPLPDFELRTVELGDTLVSKADLPNEPFVLNVWGSYCLPCLQENPILMAAKEQNIVPIVGVNYKDRLNMAQMWLEDNGSPFEFSVVDQDGRLGINLGVYGAPETFVVDGHGVIRYKHIGVIDYRIWEDEIMPAIAAVKAEAIN